MQTVLMGVLTGATNAKVKQFQVSKRLFVCNAPVKQASLTSIMNQGIMEAEDTCRVAYYHQPKMAIQ